MSRLAEPLPSRRARIRLDAGLARHVVLLLLVFSLAPPPAGAVRGLEAEETLADLLQEPPVDDEAGEEEGAAERRWAILPQLGYDPQSGFEAGAKFTDRNFLSSGATFDVDALWATEGQATVEIQMATLRPFGRDLPVIFRALFDLNPSISFFGLGNNDQGPDPASSHELQSFGGDITVGWPLLQDLMLSFQVGGWANDVRNGNRVDDSPPTPQRFPDLPGIDGGRQIPFGVSLVYDDRDSITRPTQGWRAIAKVSQVARALGSDFTYTRLVGDVGYLYPFFDDRLILGARVGGQWVGGDFDDIPFWDLPVLGGSDTLRGYFPERFLGTSALWANLEARTEVYAFDLFDWWRIRMDAVGFTDFGRVFLSDDDLSFEGPITPALEQNDDLRVAYGAGLRFAFSEAILVRLDAGFSDEETGLIYFTFGHTF